LVSFLLETIAQIPECRRVGGPDLGGKAPRLIQVLRVSSEVARFLDGLPDLPVVDQSLELQIVIGFLA
jgi:hypothetical protein